VENVLTQFFEGPTPGKIVGKTRLFREIPEAERKRPGLGGEMLMEGITRHHGIHIAWINLI
jgi:hypothetical protein